MSATIHIRNVPEELYRKLEARAALAGMSLSDYLLGEIRAAAERPMLGESRLRMGAPAPTAPLETPADAVRAERERR